jgi:hypothetical protein
MSTSTDQTVAAQERRAQNVRELLAIQFTNVFAEYNTRVHHLEGTELLHEPPRLIHVALKVHEVDMEKTSYTIPVTI